MLERINIENIGLNYCKYIQVYTSSKTLEKSKEPYDVIYMLDGQNLFDKSTSAFGMIWNISDIMDNRNSKKLKPYIIVGIECASMERYNFYSPWACSFERKEELNYFYGGKAEEYANWIINKLMPFIKNKYYVSKNTYLAGSSMGGLFSLYAGIKYSNIFKAVGVFSPAIWFAKQELINYLNDNQEVKLNVYLDIGFHETSDQRVDNFETIYLKDARKVNLKLKKMTNVNLLYIEDPNGEHNELSWQKRFENFINFIEILSFALL